MPQFPSSINTQRGMNNNQSFDDLDVSLVSSASVSSPLLIEPDSADIHHHPSRSHSVGSNDSGSDGPAPSAVVVDGNDSAKHSYGSFTAYCFTVNYILGVGVLGMPHAFVKAGWFLSLVCLLLVTLMATLTALWLTSVGQRAQRYLHHKKSSLESLSSPRTATIIADHRIEVNELVEIYLGKSYRRFYEVLLAIYMIGALWSYAAVFSQSLEEQIPISAFGSNLYHFYLLMFAVAVVPLTCMEMTELKPLAIGLAIFRFVSLGLMMLTALIAIYSYPSDDLKKVGVEPRSGAPYYSDMAAVVWPGLALAFPVSIYSQIFHHSVPGLSYPITNKKALPKVFSGVLMTTFGLYAGLGILVGLYYGSAVQDVCTLNWSDYTGSEQTSEELAANHQTRHWFASIISYLIVLFPPIDIISAFPLNAITLANNVMSAVVPIKLTTQRRYIIPFRLGAAAIPIIGAIFVSSLSKILNYTGCVGVMIAFLYPVMLQHRSQQVNALHGWGEAELVEHHSSNNKVNAVNRFVQSKAAKIIVGLFSLAGLITVIVLSIIDPQS